MKLFIKDVDITDSDQSFRSCKYTDYAGGHADVLQIIFNDTYDLWRTWKLCKNDKIKVIKDNIDTGDMYVSNISIADGAYVLKALSTPASSLNESSNIRENIKLLEICSEISKELKFNLLTYDIADFVYSYVERVNLNPISYLESILLKEGYLQKIFNNKLIVFSEKKLENVKPEIVIAKEDFIVEPNLSTSDVNIVSSVENLYQHENGLIKNEVSSGLNGRRLLYNIPVASIGEGERFCSNIMRYYNKYEYVGSGYVENDVVTAGVTVNLQGDFAEWSGNNFVYEVKHDLIRDNKFIKFRKPIQGGY